MTSPLPDFEAVRAAAARIAAEAVRTPLLTSAHLDAVTGCRVFIKPENLQRTGSFKFRGAYNTLATLTGTERNRGVLAVSSGNHAQGVAEAARFFGASATILMPSDAPQAKIERTQRSGAEVILFDRVHDDREARALGRLTPAE